MLAPVFFSGFGGDGGAQQAGGHLRVEMELQGARGHWRGTQERPLSGMLAPLGKA